MRTQIGKAALFAGALTMGAAVLGHATTAQACGGFFCDNPGGNGPTPVVQAAERVMFEKHDDGTIRAYIQIRYTQQSTAPVGFSWIIPVSSVPEVGVADTATFDQIDQATAPQFRFINNATPVGGGGGGFGCSGASASTTARGAGGTTPTDVPGVMVWGATRVGNYDTATISGTTSSALLQWLGSNGYAIPPAAGPIIQQYVDEGHLFVAFRYDPIDVGTGTLQPVVLTYTGDKPCVPIRITAIATQPILDIVVIAFGDQRASPSGEYVTTEPSYDAIRQDPTMGTNTTYPALVSTAIDDAGGHALITEVAEPTDQVQGITDVEAQAILARNQYVTRFYTRLTPELMTLDPEFAFPGGEDVPRMHVIDITPRSARLALSSPLRYAAAPGTLVLAALALLWRRRLK